MFTGIIQDQGRIEAIEKSGDWILSIRPMYFDLSILKLGDSIACNGVCLTVIGIENDTFRVQVSNETLTVTTAKSWAVGQMLNLERSLRLGDTLDGHLVYGHVDGTASLAEIMPDMDSHRLTFLLPENLAKYVAFKGSIAIDGVSLTVNWVDGKKCGVNIIPHTWQVTNLGALPKGALVNVEIDMLARYVERLSQFTGKL